jgi:hypothetical protein
LIVNRAEVQNISTHPNVMSHIGSSSEIEELSFAATRPLTARIAVREALSWSIARQASLYPAASLDIHHPNTGLDRQADGRWCEAAHCSSILILCF